MFKVGDRVKVVGNKYPVDNRDIPMEKERSGHGFDIGDIGVITRYDNKDIMQPYNVIVDGSEWWVAETDIGAVA